MVDLGLSEWLTASMFKPFITFGSNTCIVFKAALCPQVRIYIYYIFI